MVVNDPVVNEDVSTRRMSVVDRNEANLLIDSYLSAGHLPLSP